jgi:hypothetical protein
VYLKCCMVSRDIQDKATLEKTRGDDALVQLTSSQQALPYFLPSQGLYALLLMKVRAGVRSLSARSFKVRHVMHAYGSL